MPVLLAVPALAFDTGSPGVDELSASSPARQDAEAITEAVGPGWEAPFILIAVAREARSPRRLALLSWPVAAPHRRATRVSSRDRPRPDRRRRPPAALARQSLDSTGSERSCPELARLGPGLRHAAARSRGSAGISRSQRRQRPARRRLGPRRAGRRPARRRPRPCRGGRRTRRLALDRLAPGSRKLAAGQRKAARLPFNSRAGLAPCCPASAPRARPRPPARRPPASLRPRPTPPWPRRPTKPRSSLASSPPTAKNSHRLRGSGRRPEGGLGRSTPAADSACATASAASPAAPRPERRPRTPRRRAPNASPAGLGALQGGAEALSSGLAEGSQRAYPLQQGLSRAGARSARAAPRARARAAASHLAGPLSTPATWPSPRSTAPPPARRSLAAEVVDVARGGQAARYLIVPTSGFNTPGSRALGSRCSPPPPRSTSARATCAPASAAAPPSSTTTAPRPSRACRWWSARSS